MTPKKEMTALGPAVGAAGGQSNPIDYGNSIPVSAAEINQEGENSLESFDAYLREIQQWNDPHRLHIFNMEELYQTAYEGRPPVVEGLLYTGAYILAGAPKIGKSFLVAQIAYHVSKGEPLWSFPVRQGTVLYLALEDDFQRLQKRMFMMYNVNDTPDLCFATHAEKLGNGLDEQLTCFLREHAKTRLIVIDTLQKIREIGGEAYSYASDYEIIGRLKTIADQYGICILAVHHTRKQPAGDTFEMISGTTGLLGCADGSLLMQKPKRTALESTIDVVGRDQQDQILYLTKDPRTQIWTLERTATELHKDPPDPILETVAERITDVWSGSPTELVELLAVDLQPNTLTKHLNVNSGRLLCEHGIRYEYARIHAGRRITLTPVLGEA